MVLGRIYMEGIAMLVLSRKKNERLIIGDHIKIQVIEIRHGFVRLGIEAPKDVPIFREELCQEAPPEHHCRLPGPVR